MNYFDIAKHISENDRTTIACLNSTMLTTNFLTILAGANSKHEGQQIMCIKKSNLQVLMHSMKSSRNQRDGVVSFATKQTKEFKNSKLDGGLATTPLVYTVPDPVIKYFMLKFSSSDNLAAVNMHFCDVLVVDEVNSGDIDINFLVYLYDKAYSMGAVLPKLVLIYNKDYMVGADFSLKSKSAVVQYHHKDLNIHSDDSTELIVKTINSYLMAETDEQGILVYLPSDESVAEISSYFNHETHDIIKLYGSSKTIDMKQMGKGDGRRIILATPESDGIQFENISVVFDSLYKEGVFNGEIKRYYISKELADRRATLASKYCYRMAKKGYYTISTSSVNINDAAVMDLEPIYLRILLMGMRPEEFLLKIGITESALASLLDRMDKFDLINIKKDITLTSLGRFVIKSPAPFMEAIIIYKVKNKFLAIVFAAVATNANFTTELTEMPEMPANYETNQIAISMHIILNVICGLGGLNLKDGKGKLKSLCSNMHLDMRTTMKILQTIKFWNGKQSVSMKTEDFPVALDEIGRILNEVYTDHILLKSSAKSTDKGTDVVCTSHLKRRINWHSKFSLSEINKITKILPFEKQIMVESGANKVVIDKCWTWSNRRAPNVQKVRIIKASAAVEMDDDDLIM